MLGCGSYQHGPGALADNSLSRRDALGLLIGAPLASACDRISSPKVSGAIRGGNAPLGHTLRQSPPSALPPVRRRVRTVIVGSGVAGLSCAWRLQHLGSADFELLELESQAGGTAAYGSDGVVPYPWGAHYVPVPGRHNRALTLLLREISALEPERPGQQPVAHEQLLVREPEERLFIDGAWQAGLYPSRGASAGDLKQRARFEALVTGWVKWRDARGRPAFTIPIAYASDDTEVLALDKLTAAQWCEQHGLSSARLLWYLGYACRDDFGTTLAQTSAWALMFYFCSRVREPEQESAPFIAWPEGNGRLTRHMAGVAGKRLRRSCVVREVVPSEQYVDLLVTEPHGGSYTLRADHVVLAVPRFIATRILRPWRRQAPKHNKLFSYSPWMVANLHLKQRPEAGAYPLAWDNVIYDSDALGYVVATHQALRDRGETIFTYYHPFCQTEPAEGRRRLLAMKHEDFAESVLTDLSRAHPDLRALTQRLDVWRWGHGMVRPVPGLAAVRQQVQKPHGRVHFAHSDLSGVGLFEEAQYHGVRAAEGIQRSRGQQFDSWIDS